VKTPNSVTRVRFGLLLLLSIALLVLLGLLSLRFGAVSTPLAQIVQEFAQGKGLVVDYRLPRLLIAVLIGINMAVAGCILQGVTRNPLASPDLIGITAGGGLASVVLLLMVPDFPPLLLPICAFGGAVAAGGIVYVLARGKNGAVPERLALSGVAFSSGIHALITLLIVKYAPSAAQALVFLKGSLYARSWTHVAILWPWTVIGITLALLCYRQLNLLLLSEETVKGLGLPIEHVRFLLIGIAVALAGSSVAVAGTMGFVGLVVPHVTRLLVGSDYRYVLPVSALFGAMLMVLADLLGRTVMPPAEVPAGLITSLLGAPYFIYLLIRRKIS
jgi:ABC-type Fe3+-siderophore transport system permease subunit